MLDRFVELIRRRALFVGIGAIGCGLALIVYSALIDTTPDVDPVVVEDPTSISLPTSHEHRNRILVYGRPVTPEPRESELGCELSESQALLMPAFGLFQRPPVVTVDGQELEAYFEVKNAPSGTELSCTNASSIMPMAVLDEGTYGMDALLAKIGGILVGAFGIVAGGVFVVLWLLVRRPRTRPTSVAPGA